MPWGNDLVLRNENQLQANESYIAYYPFEQSTSESRDVGGHTDSHILASPHFVTLNTRKVVTADFCGMPIAPKEIATARLEPCYFIANHPSNWVESEWQSGPGSTWQY